VRWIRRLFHRDTSVLDIDELDQRVADAQRQRVEAAAIRSEAEKLGPRNRRHVAENNFGERIRLAFEARERHA